MLPSALLRAGEMSELRRKWSLAGRMRSNRPNEPPTDRMTRPGCNSISLGFRTVRQAISFACNSDRGACDGIVSAGFGDGHAGFGISRGITRQGGFALRPD